MVIRSFVLGLALASGVGGCTVTPDIKEAYQQFQGHMAECSSRFGYDPERPLGADEQGLAPGEQDWRECVYAGVERYLVPSSAIPDEYRALVEEDRRMTARVSSGQMSREERRRRLESLLETLKKHEDEEQARRLAELSQIVQDMRERRRQIDIIQQINRVNAQSLSNALGR